MKIILDIFFNQCKKDRKIAKQVRISTRHIGEIINRVCEEWYATGHKPCLLQLQVKVIQG